MLSFQVGDLIKFRYCPSQVGIIEKIEDYESSAKYKILWIAGNSWLTHLMKSQMVKVNP